MRIAISGHRGLSRATSSLIEKELRERLAAHGGDDLVGISSLADGPDQLFARAVLERGGRLEVIVPAAQYRAALPETAWAEYDALTSQASSVAHLPYAESSEEAHMAAGQALVAGADLLVAVWDGAPARGLGGTADVVAHARRLGVPVDVVWPVGATRD
jgi:hypothetical protein